VRFSVYIVCPSVFSLNNRDSHSQSSGFPWWLKNLGDGQNNTETRPLDEVSLTLPGKKFEFPAFWPLVIHLELVENRERFPAFFFDKIVILVHHLGWCDEWCHCSLNVYFVNWCSVLHLHPWKICSMMASAVLVILTSIWH